MVSRGDIWWADLGPPVGSAPGFDRPFVIVSANRFNATRIGTVIGVAIYSNMDLAKHPGNVSIRAGAGGLDRDCVANVTQLATLDRSELAELIGVMPDPYLKAIDDGLRLVLELDD